MLLLCLLDEVLIVTMVISFIYYAVTLIHGEPALKYDYNELLKRAQTQIPEVTLKRERLEMPRLFVSMVGMRTTIANFKETADMLDRDPQHILKFLTREMATAATYNDGRAIFQGKFPRDTFERLLQRHKEAVVNCSARRFVKARSSFT